MTSMVQSMLIKCWNQALGVLVMGVLSSSCAKSSSEQAPSPGPVATSVRFLPSPPPRAPVLWLQPTDLTTLVAGTPIEIVIDSDGRPLTDDEFASIETKVQFVRQDGLTPIGFTTQRINPTPVVTPQDTSKGDPVAPRVDTSSAQPERAYLRLLPQGALVGGWNVLALSDAPPGMRVAPNVAPSPPLGKFASRFNVDSSPVIQRVQFCDKGGGAFTADVVFSENVSFASSVGSLLRIDQPSIGKQCTVSSAGPQAPDSVVSIQLSCAGFSNSAPWRIWVASGIRGSTGTELHSYGGGPAGPVLLDYASLPVEQSVCRVWRQ